MPDENTIVDIAGSHESLLVLAVEPSLAALARAIDVIDAPGVVAVVVPEAGALGAGLPLGLPLAPLLDGQLLVRCAAVTDAIKRVRGREVVETVDREQLRNVELPMVIPIGLAKRWASMVLGQVVVIGDQDLQDPWRRRPSAAALLSQLVLVDPDLRAVGFDHFP